MKRILALLLAFCLLLSLAACGKKDPAETPSEKPGKTDSAAPGQQEEEAPFVEEVPASNELDASSPIPADTGTLELAPVTFENANLVLNLPEGVSAVEGEGTDNNASICVTDDAGVWKMYFEPYKDGRNVMSFITSTMIYAGNPIKQDWSQNVATELAGFPARVWANNILPGWVYPENRQDTPAVDVILDYGETLVGPWYGMNIRLEAQDPTDDTNIYEILYLRHVRAVLQNFEVIETPNGVTKSAGGITLTFPARWNVLTGDNGFVTSFNSEGMYGGINFGTDTPADPAEAAANREGETFEKTIGGREYLCVIEERSDDPETVYYNMRMYSEFSGERCLYLFLNLRGYMPSDYKAYLDSEAFTSVLESMEIDPNGYRKPGTASANGFETDRGTIYAYTGSESQLEIPAVIGDIDTTTIGRFAFAENTDITSVVIPEGVTVIESCAFENCTNLETVVLPNTVMEVGAYAFAGCSSLKDVVLPASVVWVGGAAFSEAGCGSFTGPGAEYSYNCFNASGFDSITIGNGADLSGDFIFTGSLVTEVQLPADLEVLGQGAFSGCQNLDVLDLPDTLRELGPNCFTNMGYLQISLSESLEAIPDSTFSSTNLDVLVVPESVQRIESYAIYDAAYVVLTNPAVELYSSAIDCDYLHIEDAAEFVFPDEMVLWTGWLYLDGVYDPAQIQGNLAAQYVDTQVFLPMDATMDETAAMDEYLLSIGMEDIAWIGTDKDFLPTRTSEYEVDGYVVTAYNGTGALATLPENVMIYDDPFWYTTLVEGYADGVFAGSGITTAYFRSNLWSGVGAEILKDCAGLKDIWFNTSLLSELENGNYSAQTFVGVPDGVIVHLPECLEGSVEAMLGEVGMPDTVVYEYYSLR